MDHFAKPDDDLAVAQRQGRLHRNFQGYSTHADVDMLACGVSAISAVGSSYSQNEKELDAYYRRLDNEELPLARGGRLPPDDMIRRSIIQSLMCNFEFSISAVEQIYPIAFNEYFADELHRLQQFVQDGLVSLDGDWITVSAKGRLLIRNVCMVFDKYLAAPVSTPRYSRTI
jgi:oxygen-independent coproporphyrinogen-3 oxidase